MVKKLKYIFLGLLLVIISIFSFGLTNVNNKVYASGDDESGLAVQSSILNELTDFIQVGFSGEEKTRSGRIPGSKAEYNAAMYIKNELSKLNNFKAVNNSSTKDGVETFEFECLYDGNMYVSQNIIFKRESIVETDRKVILATHYDTAYVQQDGVEYKEGGLILDGVNDNAASVATLLTIVKNLDTMPLDYGYDIEVVFFGASTNNYDGSSYYVRGQSEAAKKDTLLMVNLDKIALGDYNYIYVNEFETDQEKYIFSKLNNFKKLKNENTLDFSIESPNGLSYTHIGLESDHANFMERNINVVSFFSGNYESLMTYGLKEYDGKENITYTENDSYLYITMNYGDFSTNLYNVYSAVNTLLADTEFVSFMEKSNGLDEVYKFWTNEKLVAFVLSMLFVLLLFIYLLIYKNLQDKSRKALETSNIDNIVIKISKNISNENDEELNDAIDKKIKNDTNKDKE